MPLQGRSVNILKLTDLRGQACLPNRQQFQREM
jgi:hypothetical protein